MVDTSNRLPRICLINPYPPCVSPRLVRNADVLAEAGYDVVVVSTRYAKRIFPNDQDLPGHKWKLRVVDMSDSWTGRVRWQFARLRRKLSLALANRFPLRFLLERSCCYAGPELASLAARQNAVLYIAHTHGALPSAASAALQTGAILVFDAEDLLAESSAEPVPVMRAIEQIFVPRCSTVLTMSKAAAERLRKKLTLAMTPLVLHNTPLLEERRGVLPPNERPASKKISIYWFGQTIGWHSCADQVLRAIPLLSKPARLVLRGKPDQSYIEELRSLALKLDLADSLEIYPLASPSAMVRLAAEHDVLLGSQPSAEPFHQMAIGNKVFTGLIAGLALALTDTVAHRVLLEEIPGCGFLFPNGDHQYLALRLNELLSDPEKLVAAKSAAWRLSQERFSWELESRELLKRVSDLLVT